MRKVQVFVRTVVGAACSFLLVSLAAGEDWTGDGGDGAWGTGLNWSDEVVPPGNTALFFTNAHVGTVGISLDGDRTQNGLMTFDGGDWRIEPGSPVDSVFTNLAGGLTIRAGSVLTFAVPTYLTNAVYRRGGAGEWRLEETLWQRNNQNLVLTQGMTRVSANGALRLNQDVCVDGTSTLEISGGNFHTRLIRMGQDEMADGALFRMTSGTVRAGGSGNFVIIVGYGAGARGEGSARAEILGGSFIATGTVDNAYVSIGPDREGTLVVDGPTAVLDVSRIYLGWRDNGRGDHGKTNRFYLRNGAEVYASEFVGRGEAQGYSEVHLEAGGKLFTPRLATSTGSHLAIFWSGTVWTQSAPSAPGMLFNGNSTVTLQGTGSTLVVAGETVNWGAANSRAPVSGDGWLRKAGEGTLRMTPDVCDLSAWTGGLELAEGDLDVSAQNLNVPLVAMSAGSTLVASNTVLSALTLMSGTLTLEGERAFIGELEIPDGENAELLLSGIVTVGRLTGGGTLTVDGGGSVCVMDAGGFTGSVTVEQGTDWEEDCDSVQEVIVRSALTLTLTQNTTLQRVVFVADGTLTITGSYALAVEDMTLMPNVTGTLMFGQGALSSLPVGSLNGTGTLALPAGKLVVAELGYGVGFDLLAGEIEVTMAASPLTPPVFEEPPAFWVDASDTSSMTFSGSNLTQWRDKRFTGGQYVNFAVANANAPVLLAPETALNGKSAVKFVSPSSDTYKGMAWDERLTNIRSVFLVVGAQEGGGQLLGDVSGGRLDFFRGEVINGIQYPADSVPDMFAAAIFSQRFYSSNRDGIRSVVDGVTRLNGAQRDFRQTAYPSAGYHLVSLRTLDDTCAAAFASERNQTGSSSPLRSGCQRLAEVLVFTNAVSDAELVAIETYLNVKWFGGGVRTGRVRLGSGAARFDAVNTGAVIIDTLEIAAPDIDFDLLPQVTGVKKIDTLAVTAPIHFEIPPAFLPESTGPSAIAMNELRLVGGAEASVKVSPAFGTTHLWTLSGDGTLNVTGASGSVQVPGVKTVGGGRVTLNTPAVPASLYAWAPQNGFLALSGCTSLNIGCLLSNTGHGVSYTGPGTLLLHYAYARTFGNGSYLWSHTGNIDAAMSRFLRSGQANATFAFNLDTGGLPFKVDDLSVENSTVLTRTGPDTIQIGTQLNFGNGAALTFDSSLFADGYISNLVMNNSPTVTITGATPLTLGTLRNNTSNASRLVLATDAALTVTNLVQTGTSFTFPTTGSFTVLSLQPNDTRIVVLPPGRITVVDTLTVGASGSNRRAQLQGGVLQILQGMTATGYILENEGIIFPDGTMLTASQLDIRRDTMLDVGETGVLDVTAAWNVTNALTLVSGTMNIAAGQTVTLAALTGNAIITLAADATLNVLSASAKGFDGTIVNNGGTVNTPDARLKVIPMEPVVSPAFWVDASQSGSFQTNASDKLVWIDKRTARDGTPGLMYATALSNSLPPILENELNGLPVVDFGKLGVNSTDERGMVWNQRLTSVQAVHWVIGAQNGGGQLLGDMNSGGDIDWFRFTDASGDQTYNFGYADYRTPLFPLRSRWGNRANRMDFIHNGTGYLNGVQNDGLAISNGFPSAGYHLVSFRTTGPTYAAAFASERVGNTYGTRSGAQRLGEVLVYTIPLTAEQNRDNDAYLRWKWWGERLETYRLPTEGLLVLSGNGTFNGTSMLARELAPGAGGMSFGGTLVLDFYPETADTGTIIRLDTLPAPGAAAISALGDIHLSTHGTIILGEVKAGNFTVLETGGDLLNAANIANWSVDLSAIPNVSGYKANLRIEGNAVMLDIRAKGTVILLR